MWTWRGLVLSMAYKHELPTLCRRRRPMFPISSVFSLSFALQVSSSINFLLLLLLLLLQLRPGVLDTCIAASPHIPSPTIQLVRDLKTARSFCMYCAALFVHKNHSGGLILVFKQQEIGLFVSRSLLLYVLSPAPSNLWGLNISLVESLTSINS